MQYQKDFHALDLGFGHRNGVGETGWDRFMTGGIATIGSSPFALFRPNPTILVIDEKRILQASGHAGKVIISGIEEFTDSTDLVIFRKLKQEIRKNLSKVLEDENNLNLGLKFDDVAIITHGLKKIFGLEKWRADKPAFKLSTGIHCSNYIACLLEKSGVSMPDGKHWSRIAPTDLFTYDTLYDDQYCGLFSKALVTPQDI